MTKKSTNQTKTPSVFIDHKRFVTQRVVRQLKRLRQRDRTAVCRLLTGPLDYSSQRHKVTRLRHRHVWYRRVSRSIRVTFVTELATVIVVDVSAHSDFDAFVDRWSGKLQGERVPVGECDVINKSICSSPKGDCSDLLTSALSHSHVWTYDLLGDLFGHCNAPSAAARAWVWRMFRDGLVHMAQVDAYPTPRLSRPLHFHRQGNSLPDFDCLAYALQQRWNRPSKMTRIVWPSSEFGRLHGAWSGSDKLPTPHKVGHDLLCSAVWLRYLRTDPQVAKNWISERKIQHDLQGKDGRVPDALIERNGKVTAIEIGGNYPANWLRKHAEGFESQGWDWVLW